MVLGARLHVVLAGETAVHQRLHEIAAGPFLGLVDAALPQHLRSDDRRRLFGDDRVLGQLVRSGRRPRRENDHPASNRLPSRMVLAVHVQGVPPTTSSSTRVSWWA